MEEVEGICQVCDLITISCCCPLGAGTEFPLLRGYKFALMQGIRLQI